MRRSVQDARAQSGPRRPEGRRLFESPDPATTRLPTTDRSAHCGRQPSGAFRPRAKRSTAPVTACAERSSVQLLVRCNGNLTVIDYRRRLAAQRDSVAADDIHAHEWVLLIGPAAVPP